jgi:xanthine dehydrogenase accessory factor
MDIFIEPVLPQPKLLILGASPVAVALAARAPTYGFAVTIAAAPAELGRFAPGLARYEGVAPPSDAGKGAYVVISTQGAGDRAALTAAAAMPARYRAFVGSRRKAETLRRDLAADGVSAESLAGVKAPAGLDISAITAEEIALSILAEMIVVRRRPERPPAADNVVRGAAP